MDTPMKSTNPMPDAGRTYSDAEIEAELARWNPYRHFNGPIETIQWFATHTTALLAIVAQLRAERDAALSALETDDKSVDASIAYFQQLDSRSGGERNEPNDATLGPESEGE